MWHTSSLLHDDVIDHAESRRGKESVNKRFDPAKSIFAGDYILGVSSKLLAQTGNPDVVITMSQVLFPNP
jgi:geranylgeranyl pyrophosphate synthase